MLANIPANCHGGLRCLTTGSSLYSIPEECECIVDECVRHVINLWYVTMTASVLFAVSCCNLCKSLQLFLPPVVAVVQFVLQQLADKFNVPVLGQIPLVQKIREGGDSGRPIMMDESEVVSTAFFSAAENLAQQIAIRNANLPKTEPVKMR